VGLAFSWADPVALVDPYFVPGTLDVTERASQVQQHPTLVVGLAAVIVTGPAETGGVMEVVQAAVEIASPGTSL
jgi:hypothetical protein